jgi:hypothetical protein
MYNQFGRQMAAFEFRILTEDYGGNEEEMMQQGLAVIEAAIEINVRHFQRKPEDICALACGKIKYDDKKKNILSLIGEIRTVPVLIKKGIGLCFDIVAFDVAAKRFEGYTAYPVIINRKGGFFHFVTGIHFPDGRKFQYDPSQELVDKGFVKTEQPEFCCA